MSRHCIVRDLGRMSYAEALGIQQQHRGGAQAGARRRIICCSSSIRTWSRSAATGIEENLLASEEALRRAGIELHETDRGGDVTYHGPGQIVAYPIMDLREWKRDVGAFVRGDRTGFDRYAGGFRHSRRGALPKLTGVWVERRAKIAAIGVHLSRWVSTHGWALNVSTDLRYFEYIVPCGLTKPVTSMAALGVRCRCRRCEERAGPALRTDFRF